MIPTTGAITTDLINAELGRSAGSPLSMSDVAVRLLTCSDVRQPALAAIYASDLRGRSAYGFNVALSNSPGPGYSYALSGDALNASPLGMVGSDPAFEVFTGPAVYAGGGYTRLTLQAAPYPSFYAFTVWTLAGALIGVAKASELLDRGTSTSGGLTYSYFGWEAARLDLRPYLNTTVRCVVFV